MLSDFTVRAKLLLYMLYKLRHKKFYQTPNVDVKFQGCRLVVGFLQNHDDIATSTSLQWRSQ